MPGATFSISEPASKKGGTSRLPGCIIIGCGVLVTLVAYTRSNGPAGKVKIKYLESGATFWHLVDLLWIVLFALLYLVGQS